MNCLFKYDIIATVDKKGIIQKLYDITILTRYWLTMLLT